MLLPSLKPKGYSNVRQSSAPGTIEGLVAGVVVGLRGRLGFTPAGICAIQKSAHTHTHIHYLHYLGI